MSSEASSVHIVPAVFACECEERHRVACNGEPFFRKHNGKRYCVLHYPGDDKQEEFKEAYKRKLEAQDFIFCGIRFTCEVNFDKLTIDGDVDFSNAIFYSDVSFHNTEMRGGSNFSAIQCRKKANFSQAIFRQCANFRSSKFAHESVFTKILFNQGASFEECEFLSNVSFQSSKFLVSGNFDSCKFNDSAFFSSIKFNAPVSYVKSHFNGKTDFSASRFSHPALFNASSFLVSTKFSQVSFDSLVNFNQANFRGKTEFDNTYFNLDANFEDATFKKPASFQQVTFQSKAIFNNTNFCQQVSFNNSKFHHSTDFIGSQFCKHLKMDEITSWGGRSLNAYYNREGNDPPFQAGVSFDSCQFLYKVSFQNSSFYDLTTFEDATFKSVADFTYSTFEFHATFYLSTFLDNCDFSYSIFKGDVDFHSSSFQSSAIFSYTTFEGDTGFYKAKFSSSLVFSHADGDGGFQVDSFLNFQHAHFDKPELVSFHTLKLRPSWFINVDSRKFVFINISMEININRDVDSLTDLSIVSPHRLLAVSYRQLAVNAEENHRYSEAAELRYASMDVRRQETWHDRISFWRLGWWYWLASGYGERTGKAAFWLFAIFILYAGLYTKVGFVLPKNMPVTEAVREADTVGLPIQSIKKALIYSLEVSALQKPEPKPLTDAARLLVLSEMVLSPLQAALLALAIRRRFMR